MTSPKIGPIHVWGKAASWTWTCTVSFCAIVLASCTGSSEFKFGDETGDAAASEARGTDDASSADEDPGTQVDDDARSSEPDQRVPDDAADAGPSVDQGSPDQGAPTMAPDATMVERDSGAITPLSPIPTTGLILWLQADVGLTVEANGTVSAWQDGSPRHNDAVQSKVAQRPAVTNAWRAAKPAVTFDGAQSFLSLPAGFDDFSAGLSLFVVTEVTGAPHCASLLNLSNGGENQDISLHRDENDVFGFEVDQAVVNSKDQSLPRNTPIQLEVIQTVDGKAKLFSAGKSTAEGDSPLPIKMMRQRNDVGRTSYAACEILKGQIAEMVMYSRSLGEVERVQVEAYLKQKWQL